MYRKKKAYQIQRCKLISHKEKKKDQALTFSLQHDTSKVKKMRLPLPLEEAFFHNILYIYIYRQVHTQMFANTFNVQKSCRRGGNQLFVFFVKKLIALIHTCSLHVFFFQLIMNIHAIYYNALLFPDMHLMLPHILTFLVLSTVVHSSLVQHSLLPNQRMRQDGTKNFIVTVRPSFYNK